MQPLPTIGPNKALVLEARVDHYDEEAGVERNSGDLWQLEGPRTYRPNPNVVSDPTVTASLMKDLSL